MSVVGDWKGEVPGEFSFFFFPFFLVAFSTIFVILAGRKDKRERFLLLSTLRVDVFQMYEWERDTC